MYESSLRDTVMQALGNLTFAELDELDAAVTPRVAHLLAKAFGPEMAVLLAPLYRGER